MTNYIDNDNTEYSQEEINEYLDDLRDSGITNMFGAPSYVATHFGISEKQAREAWKNWIKTHESDRE